MCFRSSCRAHNAHRVEAFSYPQNISDKLIHDIQFIMIVGA